MPNVVNWFEKQEQKKEGRVLLTQQIKSCQNKQVIHR
jgi:hypothetical protein